MMTVRRIDVRERVMARNDAVADVVRTRLVSAGVRAINLLSSPGAGKTTLLEHTLDALGDAMSIAVITGDVQTQNDADRLACHTTALVQAVVTNGACHLDAVQVATALDAIDLAATDLLFIENVGNLVCPANWDLGEAEKVVLLSVTEGDDKPEKYPAAFQRASCLVITKIDLLPYVRFDLGRAIGLARALSPDIEVAQCSATTGEGMEQWYARLGERAARATSAGP